MIGCLAVVALAGCERGSIKEAEAKADFLAQHGTLGEACDAKREVQRLYAERQNAEEYERAKLFADTTCGLADLEGRDLPASQPANAAPVADMQTVNFGDVENAAVPEPAPPAADSNETDTPDDY